MQALQARALLEGECPQNRHIWHVGSPHTLCTSAVLIVYIRRSAQDVSESLTAGCVICGQVRLLWPGSPHTAQVLGTPMALSERACRASWSELMRFIDSAMRLLTARRPV